jgi:class 3 adenylate cyclase
LSQDIHCAELTVETCMSENDSETQEQRPIPRAAEKVRLDMAQQVISIDEESRIVRLRGEPDPRRYDRIERNEPGTWYLDRYFNTAFRLEDFAEQMGGLPVYASDRTVDSASEYATERRAAVQRELQTGEYVAPTQGAKPHAVLSPADEERDMAFVSVDICGSTAYRRRDPQGFETAYRIFLQELGSTVGQFQGSILKATGDGFIAFLDFPGFCVLVDSTFDLCGTMLHILHEAVNPAVEEAGLQPLSVRIGADYGPAVVREVRVPITGFRAPEVTSDALNRAVKIEQSCQPNTYRIGYDLYRLAHVQWLERCHKVEFDGSVVGIPDYEVFEVR